ncbi:MAG: type ISP restriction/modification enzyme [Defluviicoccus sp.]
MQFFYEPFLEAFDPELRKQLGVWYTPSEVVTYMVARVDRALKEDLGVAEGLAAEHVYVLDPCCGTGAYLAAVLKRIDRTLDDRGLGALKGQVVKQAATSRIFGFEIMPAPFVVAHLQLGLLLQSLGAPFAADGSERAGVYLTNALTGWKPVKEPPLPYPELEEERRRADEVKHATPILVILGNPPYNGYAGMAVQEERALSDAYRTTRRVRRPEGQGLNDLCVRFYRMAERRIVEKTGQGVVCFISNYSWLDGLSFTGMRERYLEAFDRILIDNLHGDRIISEYAADGRSSETIFAVRGHSPGIKVGTAIATLIKSPQRGETGNGVWYRDFDHARADERRAALIDASQKETLCAGYQRLSPSLPLGLPFKRMGAGDDYLSWPRLPELVPASFPGVKTSRDDFVVAIDRATLEERLEAYFDPAVSHAELRARYPSVMTASERYNPEQTRDTLRRRGGPLKENIVRYAYRPFDIRWLYWEPETDLLDRKREDHWPHVFAGNIFISAGARNRKEEFYQPQIAVALADHHLVESNVGMFPAYLRHEHAAGGGDARRVNLAQSASAFLDARGLGVEDLFHHILDILHAPAYRRENAAALRMDWPRVPVPDDTAALKVSASVGRTLAALLDPEAPVAGVTHAPLRPELAGLGVPSKKGAGGLGEAERALTAGWGSLQGSGIVMPGRGKAVERQYRPDERGCLQDALPLLGETTFDIHLNAEAYWANVPAAVWRYSLGGYPVIKKWLSYRERAVLGRDLTLDEVIFVSQIVRRIAAIVLLGPALDANYHAARTSTLWQPPADRHSIQGRHGRRKAGRRRGGDGPAS